MADYLLDTHALLWSSNNDVNLSKKVAKIIINPENKIFISIVSIWEICIKISIGKLQTKIPIEQLYEYLSKNNIQLLPIKLQHLLIVKDMPLLHRDPFDRLIIAQAIHEKHIVLSKDTNFDQYENITIIW